MEFDSIPQMVFFASAISLKNTHAPLQISKLETVHETLLQKRHTGFVKVYSANTFASRSSLRLSSKFELIFFFMLRGDAKKNLLLMKEKPMSSRKETEA